MAFKQQFPTPQEQAIATYSYTDVAEGTGVIAFYGFSSETDGGTTYQLSTEAVWSKDIEVLRTATGTTELNFNLTAFNHSRRVTGTALFSCGMVSTGDGTCKVQVQVFKVNLAAAEVAVTSEIESQTISGVNETVLVPLAVTDTHFKKGESLRLSVKVITTDVHGAGIGIDPQNRDGASVIPSTQGLTSTLRLYLPFDLDL